MRFFGSLLSVRHPFAFAGGRHNFVDMVIARRTARSHRSRFPNNVDKKKRHEPGGRGPARENSRVLAKQPSGDMQTAEKQNVQNGICARAVWQQKAAAASKY